MTKNERDEEMDRLRNKIDRNMRHSAIAMVIAVWAGVILIIIKVIKLIF